MGMYTELHLGCRVTHDFPQELLVVYHCSQYDFIPRAKLEPDFHFPNEPLYLSVDISRKNYTDEINDWLIEVAKYVPLDWDHCGCDMIGWMKHEEIELPTLIYWDESNRGFKLLPVTAVNGSIP